MKTQKERLLVLLRLGWVSNVRLNRICFRYGARIFELREAGYNIVKKHQGQHGLVYYKLKRWGR